MHEFIVIGPIDGFYHLGYRLAGTKTFSSVLQFLSEKAAIAEAVFMNEGLNPKKEPL